MVAVDDQLDLIMALNDKVKVESKSMVSQLMQMNLVTTMLTGDNNEAALSVCREINIPSDQCFSRLHPMDKFDWVKRKQEHGSHQVLMIGDGINDAAALALADVGMAMGDGGTAMASHAANVVILSDNLLKIPGTIKLCKLAKSCIIQNVSFVLIIKLLAVIFALTGDLQFWMAMIVDAGCLIVVLLNGIRPMFSKAFINSEISSYTSESYQSVNNKMHNSQKNGNIELV
jgi:Cd2+/Zn2+-exporting ATPase